MERFVIKKIPIEVKNRDENNKYLGEILSAMYPPGM